MANPIIVDVPHKLGAEEAKRRMQGGLGSLTEHIPGAAEVSSTWTGDRMNLGVKAMNQHITATLDVEEKLVRVQLQLPPALSFFARPVEALLRRKAGQMLEDKSDQS